MSSATGQGRAPAVAAHRREDRVFPPLPAQHPLLTRRREVQRFRRGDGPHGRRAWNPATKDELHPFPQPALNNTTSCYNGVDVVATHFPETVRGTAFLRVPESTQPAVWTQNRDRACASTMRYTYRCPALEVQEAPLSYLAGLIQEDSRPEKRRRQQGWCASTTLDGFRGNRHVASDAEDTSHLPAHRALNETLTASTPGGYVAPYNRVKRLNASRKEDATLRQMAAAESLVGFYAAQPGPAVFKLSNADEWWDMDPVAVTRGMMEQAEAIKSNPYSTTFRSGVTASLAATRTKDV